MHIVSHDVTHIQQHTKAAWFATDYRDLENCDDLHFGVHTEMLYAKNTPPVQGAQWTGIVTQIAIEMLQSGAVDAVVCVQSDENDR